AELKAAETRPEPPKESPKPIARAEPEADQDPARAPVRESRAASVELPAASSNLARHDSADHLLAIPLPASRGYALRLRGQDDDEMHDYFLMARPSDPGRADTLTVVRDPFKGAGRAGKASGQEEVARFWVEGDQIHFRWARQLSPALIKTAGAL